MLRRAPHTVAYCLRSATRCTRRQTSGVCPFSGVVTPTVGTAAAIDAQTKTCPVMGSPALPHMACPVEGVDQDYAVTGMPFKAIVSQTGKAKLSGFVTATAVVGYVVAGGTSVGVAAALTVGTMLQSMSANTANQILERNHDKNMKRTCKRPLPTGAISVVAASALSAAEMVIGTTCLAAVSPAAAALGALNWFLYVGVYTPLKRVSAVNTWVGSIVGGIPPWMGCVAACGTLWATPASMPAHLLAAFMLVWQIPHFMALSFHCRRDYESAGYKMLAFANPWRASFYAVSMSVLLAVITMIGPIACDTAVESLWYYPVAGVANGLMIYKSVLFHQDPVRHCRSCFLFSYAYLGVMLLAFSLNHVQPVAVVSGVVERVLG